MLVVDDDEEARRLMVACLREKGGIEADVARDGAEALHRIRTGNYAVILLDLMMPHMTGIDVLDSLHAAAEGQTVPRVIVLTSVAREEIADDEIARRLPQDVVSVFRKPVEFGVLLSAIRQVVDDPR